MLKAKDDLVDSDLDKMSRDELITLVTRWRNMAPMIRNVCEELADFRSVAPNPSDLKAHIDQTMKMHRETIARQASQIEEMQQFIDEVSEDPLQIGRRLDEHMTRRSKRKLN